MTVVFRASAKAATDQLTVTIPATVQVDDGLLLFVTYYSAWTLATPPTGWTLIRADTGTGGYGTVQKAYKRVAVAGDAGSAVSVGINSSSYQTIILLAYSGTRVSDPVDVHGATTSTSMSTTITAPSVTTTASGGMIVECFGSMNQSAVAQPVVSPATQRLAATSSIYVGSATSDQGQAAAGASGSTTATLTYNGDWVGTTIALMNGVTSISDTDTGAGVEGLSPVGLSAKDTY